VSVARQLRQVERSRSLPPSYSGPDHAWDSMRAHGAVTGGALCWDRPQSSSLTARLALAFALVLAGAFSAGAETWSAGRGASSVEFRATDIPGAVAELHFDNTGGDTGIRLTHSWTLTHDGLTVTGQVDLGTGEADTIRVRVPEGFVAYPDTETIHDGGSVVIPIFPLNAVGM
jgi:hypothetical protein